MIAETEEERCIYCDQIIDECACQPAPKCPFCGDVAGVGDEIGLEHFSCDHFIAGWDDSGFYKSPLQGVHFPVLPEKLNAVELSPAKLKEGFGDAEPLLEAYGGVFTVEPDKKKFLDFLLPLLPGITDQGYYDQHSASMVGWDAVMYFAENPAEVQKRLAELICRLHEGFKLLENSFIE